MKLAAIKKIDFKFSDLMHSALVSVVGDAKEAFVHIQLINSFIRKVFGVEHIRFYHHNGEITLQEGKHPFMYQIAKLVNSQVNEDLKNADESPLRLV